MGVFKDVVNEKYGRLTVIEFVAKGGIGKGTSRWKCLCECGNEHTTTISELRSGSTRSCGCLKKENSGKHLYKHGNSGKPEYRVLKDAKKRAKNRGIEYNIDLEDIVIPSTCPILNIPIFKGVGQVSDNSPSLDRVDNLKGYIKGNVRVISSKANRLKSDGLLEQFENIIRYIKGEI